MKIFEVRHIGKNGDYNVDALLIDGECVFVGSSPDMYDITYDHIQKNDKFITSGMDGHQTGEEFVNSIKHFRQYLERKSGG